MPESRQLKHRGVSPLATSDDATIASGGADWIIASGLRLRVELRVEDVFTPLEYVAMHAVQAKRVRLERVHTDRARSSERIVRAVRLQIIEVSLLSR